jgi:hypothetical protein
MPEPLAVPRHAVPPLVDVPQIRVGVAVASAAHTRGGRKPDASPDPLGDLEWRRAWLDRGRLLCRSPGLAGGACGGSALNR